MAAVRIQNQPYLQVIAQHHIAQFFGLPREHLGIGEAMQQKSRWRFGIDETHRLPIRFGVRRGKRGAQFIAVGHEHIGARQSHEPGNAGRVGARLAQKVMIQGEDGCDLPPGRMPHEHDVAAIAAVLPDMLLHPRDRGGAIGIECREGHLWVEAIVGQDRDEPVFGERDADESILGFVALDPGAAVPKHHHRASGRRRAGRRRAGRPGARHVHIQPLARVRAIGDVANGAHGGERIRCVGDTELDEAAA